MKSDRIYAILFTLLGIIDIVLGVFKAQNHQPDAFFPYSSLILGVLFLALSVRYWMRSKAA